MPRTTHQIVRRSLLAAGGTLLAAGVAGKYLLGGRAALEGPASADGAPPPASAAQPISSLRAQPPAALPGLVFARADGAAHRLAEYAGQGVVLNFWATWCVPCVSEMPGLDALSRALAGQGIVVLAVSEDHGGAAAVQPFFAAHAIRNLPVLIDPHEQAMSALRLDGIPTTLVIDRHGQEVARIQGAVDWGAADAAATVARLLA